MRLIGRLSKAWRTFRADSGFANQVPWDDYWYAHRGYETATGLKISPESAMRVAAVYACVRVIAETIASLPLIVYRRLPDGGKERATNHPLYRVLHDKPNQTQTAYEWLEMMQGHLELRGNAFSRIVPGPNGAIDQLIPLHPDRVDVFRMADGRLRYQVRSYYSAEIEKYMQEEMFHLRGLSSDGLVGMSTIAVGAETIASSLAAQEFAGRYFENGATPSGVFTHPKVLDDASYERLKRTLRESQTGENRHKILVLEEDMKYAQMSINNRDSQLLEARQFSRGDIASLFRVPPHKIGDLTRATFSNIEQQAIEFVVDCIRSRAVRFERRVQNDLIDPLELGDGNEYFCEFLMDALLRGDLKSRYEAYAVGRQWGWLSSNDVRAMENLNPIPVGGDEYLRPLNMVDAATADPDQSDEGADQTDSTATSVKRLKGGQKQLTDGTETRLREFARSAAERVLRKEVGELRKRVEKSDGNGSFLASVDEFYASHQRFVAEAMCISEYAANVYIQGHRALFVKFADAEQALSCIEYAGVNLLASLALNDKLAPVAERPINITMPAQTINLNPSLTVQPMEMKVNIEQPSSSATKSVKLVRDKDGRVDVFKVGSDMKQFSVQRDSSGRIEKVEKIQ